MKEPEWYVPEWPIERVPSPSKKSGPGKKTEKPSPEKKKAGKKTNSSDEAEKAK